MKSLQTSIGFVLLAAPFALALASGLSECSILTTPEGSQAQVSAQGVVLQGLSDSERTRATCAEYEGTGDIHGYCLSKHARIGPTRVLLASCDVLVAVLVGVVGT